MAKKLFDDNINLYNSFWSGRPDILVGVIGKVSDNIVKIIIGEIKYTTNKNYMIKELEELLEYIYFIKEENIRGKHVFDNPRSQIDIKGILFIDKIQFKPLYSGKFKLNAISKNR